MEFDFDSPDGGDAWLLDAMATSLHFSAASPPLPPPWPCGDPHHPSVPLDTAALQDDAPGARAGKSEITKKGEPINGKCQVHLSMVDDYSHSSYFLKEKLTLALRYFKDSTNQHLLVQVWVPIRKGDRYMLSTSGQPFVLDQRSIGLLQYRAVSIMYMFSVDGNSVKDLGLPGRVYKQGVPEWTPNVQYYSITEYARLNHAISYNVHGTVALPVFDPSTKSCIAVVELIMTSKKVNYANEVGKVCKALEAVSLKSTEVVEHPYVQICNEGHHAALVEMLEVLTVIGEELKLPLAQTWVPCKYQNSLVIDAHMWGFRDACVEHHLQKGQGVSGKAFILRRPCFCKDVTRFSKMEYPLVHYARMFGLAGCFSVCLQSAYTGNDDYVLEFFLPPDCRKDDEQKVLLESILALLTQHLHSLHLATDEGSSEELQVSAITLINNDVQHLNFEGGIHASHESKTNGILGPDSQKRIVSTEYEMWLSPENDTKCNGKLFVGPKGGCTSDSLLPDNNSKHQVRRRGKAEKTFSLEVIQHYFTGSLKNAAKSLGVCPTTMKRICRQHGISRWPSRQISKVNRSISKLKKVIESVEGSESGFTLTSITGPLPVPFSPSNPINIKNGQQTEVIDLSIPSVQENRGSSLQSKLLENDDRLGMAIPQQSFLANLSRQIEREKASNLRSSSGEPSTHSGTSEESCLGSPANKTFVSTIMEPQQNMCKPDSFTQELFQTQDLLLPGLFVNGSRSSENCKNHITDAVNEPSVVPLGSLMSADNSGIVTAKARYKEDLLRFRFPCSASIIDLKDEVAKRIQADVGVFDIKYLDDDHEWVKLTCDADLEECMEISRLSGSNVLRLLVTDIAPILGSSCGSTG
ncbi:protein NLP3 isoform X2 [Setaria viridis]|uniref:protein NLP3 isoform X2 n=1 Tax=Setaria viridis TaxID=4556 RepID=UPI0014933DC2|nr:protein NLP3-like isoform X2 [Setaria viridis]